MSEELRLVWQEESRHDERRWRRAMADKRSRVPLPNRWRPTPAMLARLPRAEPAFLGRGEAEVRRARLRGPKGVDLLGGAGVDVEAGRLDGFLFIPIAEELRELDRRSLRIARWDERLQRYRWLRSSVDATRDQAWARIARGGSYALFGTLSDGPLYRAVRAYCAVRAELGDAPALEKVCDLILCEPGFERPGGYAPLCELCLEAIQPELPQCELYVLELVPAFREDAVFELPPCEESRWQSVGPLSVSGHIRRVVVDPSDSDRLYAAAWNGGIWVLDSVSQYPAVTWRPLTDQLDTLRMSAIAIAPGDPDVLYAGDVAGTVRRSEDGGASWSPPGADLGGKVRDILVHPEQAGTLWAFTNTGLWFSETAGTQWDRLRPGNVTDFKLAPGDPAIWYLAQRGVGVFKRVSEQGGFTRIFDFADADSPAATRIELALGVRHADGTLQSDADRTVVVRVGAEVWRNEAGGTGEWSYLGKRGNIGSPTDDHQLEWNHVVAVSPFDPGVIYAGGRVLHRRDPASGVWTWVAGFGAGTHEDQHCVAFDPEDPEVVYLSNDGGVYRSVDGGRSFRATGASLDEEIAAGRNLNHGLVTAEFYRVGVRGNEALGNLNHNGIWGSVDLASGEWRGAEGNSWEWYSVHADPPRDRRYFVFKDTLRLRLFPSLEGERKLLVFGGFRPVPWQSSRVVGSIAVDPRPGSTIVLAGASKTGTEPHRLMITNEAEVLPVYDETADAFTTEPHWAVAFATSDQDDDRIDAVRFAAGTARAYAMTRSGRAFLNEDVGSSVTWTELTRWVTDTGVRQLVTSPVDPDVLYAIDEDSVARGVQRDGMIFWTDVGHGTLPLTQLNSIAHHPSREFTLYLGADDGVYRSDDQGETWEPIDAGLPNAVVRQIYVEGPYLYAVTHGRGLWRLPICG